MKKKLRILRRRIKRAYLNVNLKRDYRRQKTSSPNERPVEYSFALKQAILLCPENILDVGTGKTSFPHLLHSCGFHVTATDNIKNYWKSGMYNRHFFVIDDDITSTNLKNTFELITCISVLEHIEQHDEAIKNIYTLLESGGHIILSFPYNEDRSVPNAYALPGARLGGIASYKCHVFSRENINRWLNEYSFVIVEQEYWKFWDGEFWNQGRKVLPPEQVKSNEHHQLTCILLRKK